MLQEMVNALPPDPHHHLHKEQLTKVALTKTEMSHLSFIQLKVLQTLKKERKFHLLLMVKLLHFFLQTFTLVLKMLEEVQGLQQHTDNTDENV